MGYGTRKPTSNDLPEKKSQYGPQFPEDDFSAIVGETGVRCRGCKKIIMTRHLDDKRLCPDCRE